MENETYNFKLKKILLVSNDDPEISFIKLSCNDTLDPKLESVFVLNDNGKEFYFKLNKIEYDIDNSTFDLYLQGFGKYNLFRKYKTITDIINIIESNCFIEVTDKEKIRRIKDTENWL